MDPSLLRERELFKKRALSTPAVEKRPAPSSDSAASKKKKAKVEQSGSSGSKQSAGRCEWPAPRCSCAFGLCAVISFSPKLSLFYQETRLHDVKNKLWLRGSGPLLPAAVAERHFVPVWVAASARPLGPSGKGSL